MFHITIHHCLLCLLHSLTSTLSPWSTGLYSTDHTRQPIAKYCCHPEGTKTGKRLYTLLSINYLQIFTIFTLLVFIYYLFFYRDDRISLQKLLCPDIRSSWTAKAAKEHATEFHHNPNYVLTFELLLSCIWFQITRLWFPYMETSWLGIWIVMAPGNLFKFHAPLLPSAARELLLISTDNIFPV